MHPPAEPQPRQRRYRVRRQARLDAETHAKLEELARTFHQKRAAVLRFVMGWGLAHTSEWTLDPSIPGRPHLMHMLVDPELLRQVQAAAAAHGADVAAWERHAMHQVTYEDFPPSWRVAGTAPRSHASTSYRRPFTLRLDDETSSKLATLTQTFQRSAWDRAEVFAWLQDLGVGFCNIDQPQVSYGIGLTHVVTSPVGYLRLHGRNAAMWFAEEGSAAARYDYRYPPGELEEIVDAAEILSRLARETYLITNNHFRGQAALNALELRSQLRRSPIPVPPPLLAAYPELRPIAAPAPEANT